MNERQIDALNDLLVGIVAFHGSPVLTLRLQEWLEVCRETESPPLPAIDPSLLPKEN